MARHGWDVDLLVGLASQRPWPRPGKAGGIWKLTTCSVTGTGTDKPGLGWRGILGYGQGGRKPWGTGQGPGNHGGSVSGKAINTFCS